MYDPPRVENILGQIQVTYGDPSQGSDACDFSLKGELVDHPNWRNQPVLNNVTI